MGGMSTATLDSSFSADDGGVSAVQADGSSLVISFFGKYPVHMNKKHNEV
jgi:hypothetical protein